MNSVIASVGKNLVLVGLLILTLINYYAHMFDWHDLLQIQAGFGLLYVFLSYYEFNNTWYKAQLPKERFAYYPGSFYMTMAIKTGVYVMFAIVLALSGTSAKYLYPICVIIALTKIIIGVLILTKKLCFVSIYANYILIAKEKMTKVFANEIESVEFRHEIMYLVKKDKETVSIKVFSIEKPKEFVRQMNDWIINNNLSITSESLAKIGQMITNPN